MMTLLLRAMSRCISSKYARTHGSAETFEAYIEISGRRISVLTSLPSSSIFCPPISSNAMSIWISFSSGAIWDSSLASSPRENAA